MPAMKQLTAMRSSMRCINTALPRFDFTSDVMCYGISNALDGRATLETGLACHALRAETLIAETAVRPLTR